MNVRLVVEQGARRRSYSFQSLQAVIGRGHGNAVRIPSALVSRRHCRLTIDEGLLSVKDLGSANGTMLNGRKIAGVQYVRPGDSLTVGPVTFVVEYEITEAALRRLRAGDDEPLEEVLEVIEDGVADEVLLEAEGLATFEDDARFLSSPEIVDDLPLDEDFRLD